MSKLRKLLSWLVGLVLLAAVVGMVMPRHAGLERSTHIEAPPANVFAVLNGFRNFDKWSPWTDLDPAVKVGFDGPIAGVGAGYHWSGNAKVGKGSQVITASKPDSEVDLKLLFGDSSLPSEAKFRIAPEGRGSHVTWGFTADLGPNPFSHLMAPLMRRFVGQDYERGLARLKVFVESMPKTDLTGLDAKLEPLNPETYVFVKGTSTTDLDDVRQTIAAAFAQVRAGMQKQNIAAAGVPFAITRRWDDVAKVYEFEAGIPVGASVTSVGDGLQLGKTYSGLAVQAEVKGPYSRIKHVYEQIDAYQRAYGLQGNGDVWEQYPNDPATTASADLVTLIDVPVK